MDDDKELKAMSSVSAALADLDDAERQRVITWTASKFKITISATGGQSGFAADGQAGSNGKGNASDEGGYSDFVDLYDKANPKTAADRALVAAYWVQEVGHQAPWPSQPVNDALKNLGYALTNVTDALTQLQNRKPAQVRQVQKSGGLRQSRKSYKLTVAGINAVRAMLNAAPVPGEQ